MIARRVLVSVLAVGLLVTANADAAKKNAQAAKQTAKEAVADVGALNEEYVKTIRQKLVGCQSIYANEMAMMSLDVEEKVLRARERSQYADLSFERMAAQRDVVNAKRATGFDFKKCAEDAKGDVDRSIKHYVSAFKNDSQKSLAKQIISQWFAAVDAVGEKHFGAELSKFDKASSDIKVELAMD